MILDDDLLRDQPDDLSRKQQKIANLKVGFTIVPQASSREMACSPPPPDE